MAQTETQKKTAANNAAEVIVDKIGQLEKQNEELIERVAQLEGQMSPIYDGLDDARVRVGKLEKVPAGDARFLIAAALTQLADALDTISLRTDGLLSLTAALEAIQTVANTIAAPEGDQDEQEAA